MRVVQRTTAIATLPGLASKVAELCDASQEETEAIADAYLITYPNGFLPVRTLDLTTTVTTAQLATVFATFIRDLKQRGINRKKQADV